MSRSTEVLNALLVRLFNRILAIEEAVIRRAYGFELTMSEIHVLEAVGMGEPKSMSETASQLGVTLGTLTTSVNRLVSKGYVTRIRPEEDRRVVLVKLTEAGRLPYHVHDRFHRKMVESILEGLSPEEETAVISAAEKLYRFFAKVDPMDLWEEGVKQAD
ncbi:MAG: MarR family transcriptional regulator [Firmicutes bacterium]|jgi:DNA-binding MarR family transcriptional regulator|nr:MarR family transcriptional regulator [Bacillota bacterium]